METILFEFIEKYITLTEEEKAAIQSLSIFRSVKKGTVLLSQGQRSQESYFVLKGCLRTYYMIDGDEKTTAFYTEMEAITPQCVLSREPSGYYIAALEDTLITVSTPGMEAESFEKFPRFEALCRMFSEEQLAKSQLAFDEFKIASPEERYLRLVQNRPDLLQRVPQRQLASYLGITPQSLSRLRARIFEKKK
ncbi:MAG: Crp/Fnr family transcriptional regulator [Niastella sp.]|nr:Crp/Fnr family transcriptional regulator [Niastella sp.]